MSIHMPITKDKIKNHFQYGWWKYVLLAVLSIFVWNLLFSSTHYRSPENLKIEFYADGYPEASYGEKLNALMDTIHQEVMPDMEEVTSLILDNTETYGIMQLTVWASAAQGDVYLLLNDRFGSLAMGDALMDLQPYIDEGRLTVDGIDLSKGYVRDEDTGSTTLVGIPADSLMGLDAYGLAREGTTLSILASCGNEDNAVLFMEYLLTHMKAEP